MLQTRQPSLRRIAPDSRTLTLFRAPAAQAGFPSPAADYVEETLDLHGYLVRKPQATFITRVVGDSLRDLGIVAGDLAVVDRSITPSPGKIVVAVVDGDFYFKRYATISGRFALISANRAKAEQYPPIFLDESNDHTLFGCVTGIVRKF